MKKCFKKCGIQRSARTLLLLAWAFFAIPPMQSHAIEVIARGSGVSRDAAVRAALRAALKTSISIHTGAQDAEALPDSTGSLVNETKKYISKYKILKEEESFGLYFVQVAADISADKLETDLAAQKVLYEMASRPRIAVVLDEYDKDSALPERTAATACEQLLTERGFRVIDAEFAEKAPASEADVGELASQGFGAGADLVIRGSVRISRPYETEIYGKKFSGVPVAFNGRIIRTSDGAVIAARSMTVKKNSLDPFSAAKTALRIGGQELASALVSECNAYFHRELYFGANTGLILEGFAEKELESIKRQVENLSFVQKMQLSLIEKGQSRFDVRLHGSIHDLREAVAQANPEASVAALSSHLLHVRAPKTPASVMLAQSGQFHLESFSVEKILPCRIRYYENNPLASITLASGKRAVENIALSVFIPEYMTAAAETTITSLPPLKKAPLRMHLLLKKNLLENLSTHRVFAKISLSYDEGGRGYRRSMTTPVSVFSRNAMDWTAPASLGGFVTPNDPMVQAFARSAVRLASADQRLGGDLTSAITLFQAMSSAGIAYVKDPAPRTEGAGEAIDRISYPRETLSSRTGDCDDLSVLYASLLEAVGIETAFLSYSDHILPMINTGVFEKNQIFLTPDTSLCIRHEGKLWAPVEATMLGSGFAAAWTAAAEEFGRASMEGRELAVYATRMLWEEVPPAPLPGEPATIEAPVVSNEAKKQIATVNEETAAQSARMIAAFENQPKLAPNDQNRLALLYIGAGKYHKAITLWEKLAKNSPAAQSNLACALFLAGEEKRARTLFEKIAKKDTSAFSAINHSLLEILSSDDSETLQNAIDKMRAAAQRIGPEGLSRALGLELAAGPDVRGEEKEDKSSATVDRQQLRRLIRNRVLSRSDTTRTATPSNKTGLLAIGGIRGERADPAETATLFYWFDKL